MAFSTLNLAYLLANKPLITPYDNYINIFNECSIALFSHIMTTLLNIAIPKSLVDKLGWFLIYVATFNILGNLVGMGYWTIIDVINKRRIKKMNKKINRMVEERIERR